MKKTKNIVYILIIFLLAIFLWVGNSYAFKEGDQVITTKKSYLYTPHYTGGKYSKIDRYDRMEKIFKKRTVLTYERSTGIDGICVVRSDR